MPDLRPTITVTPSLSDDVADSAPPGVPFGDASTVGASQLFVASVSHELKTPLTVIKSFAAWLADQEQPIDPAKLNLAVTSILEGVDELDSIVEKILLSARTEAGGIDLHLQPVDLARAVRAVAGRWAVPGGPHTIEVVTEPGLPTILADMSTVRTSLGQYLENAVKYSPNGGRIALSVARDGESIRVAVDDEGIGLAPGEGEYLFMPFYQGEHRADSGATTGVGLGLSIVRRLIEAQDGAVGATGERGKGSTFWFTLPINETPSDLA